MRIHLTGGDVERSAVTDGTGFFAIEDVPSEVQYTVTAELPGFHDARQTGVAVSPGRTATLVEGRVRSSVSDAFGFTHGSPLDLAFARLRDTYERYTRYRTYDDLTSTAPLETLQHKTRWFAMGTVLLDREVWTDGRDGSTARPFDLVGDRWSSRVLPRPLDRIRLKVGGPIVILDFGAHGEALRHVSPTTRPRDGHVSDLTGTRVDAGGIYTVANVDFEPIEEAGQRIVWVQLVATE